MFEQVPLLRILTDRSQMEWLKQWLFPQQTVFCQLASGLYNFRKVILGIFFIKVPEIHDRASQ